MHVEKGFAGLMLGYLHGDAMNIFARNRRFRESHTINIDLCFALGASAMIRLCKSRASSAIPAARAHVVYSPHGME